MAELVVEPWTFNGGLVVTARSHLINRINAETEIVQIKPRQTIGGKLTYEIKEFESSGEVLGRKKKLQQRLNRGTVDAGDRIFIDLRRNDPSNWAHMTTNHLPMTFRMCSQTGTGWDRIVLILPKDIPGYIKAGIDLFGFDYLCTDQPVQGTGIDFDMAPWTAIRAVRTDWVQSDLADYDLACIGPQGAGQFDLPSKAFISRRGTRVLENEAEIEALLTQRGFTKIYAEDFSALEQFRIFQDCEEIVAIHGAALGPLIYRAPNARLRRVMELFPCGHMTAVYAIASEQVGCQWIGVRGRIKPKYIKGAYDLERPFIEHSLDSFEIDPVSVEEAFDLLDGQANTGMR